MQEDDRRTVSRPQRDIDGDSGRQCDLALVDHGYVTVSGTSGSGMNSLSSPGTSGKRPAFQSSLAWLIRSREEETKFQKTWRSVENASPPSSMTRDGDSA